jgi:hypothetical protein
MQKPCAMFHSIQATINSLQDFENPTKVPCTNLLEREQTNNKLYKYQKLDNLENVVWKYGQVPQSHGNQCDSVKGHLHL